MSSRVKSASYSSKRRRVGARVSGTLLGIASALTCMEGNPDAIEILRFLRGIRHDEELLGEAQLRTIREFMQGFASLVKGLRYALAEAAVGADSGVPCACRDVPSGKRAVIPIPKISTGIDASSESESDGGDRRVEGSGCDPSDDSESESEDKEPLISNSVLARFIRLRKAARSSSEALQAMQDPIREFVGLLVDLVDERVPKCTCGKDGSGCERSYQEEHVRSAVSHISKYPGTVSEYITVE